MLFKFKIMEVTEVLNDLIKVNNDRIDGFENAGKNLDDNDVDLKAIFNSLVSDSRSNVAELSGAVGKAGGEVATGSGPLGAIHRAWIDVKATFTGNDRHSVLAECERGEDAIKKAYKDALEENNLPDDVRSMLLSEQSSVVAGHNKIKALRDSNA